MRVCLNLSILAHLDFEKELSIASQAGFKAVGLRMNKLLDYLAEGNTPAQARQLIDQYGVDPVEMNFFSNWIFAPREKRPDVLARFREFASIAEQMGCRILVCPTGYEDAANQDEGMAVENYRAICAIAAEHDLVAGLEFVPWSEVGDVKKAWDIIKQVDHPNGGLVLDCFHYYEGGSTLAELKEVPVEKVIMFHLTDVERVSTDSLVTLCRNHRPLPGEGEYDFGPLLKYLADGDYQGYYNLEIMYPGYQTLDGLEIAKRARQAIDALLSGVHK